MCKRLFIWHAIAIIFLCGGVSTTLSSIYAVGKEQSAPASKLTRSSSTGKRVSELIELQDDNWQLMLKGEWMVEFFAPWCPACKNLAPTWERFAHTAATTVNVNVAKIDVTTSPSLSGRFFVTALPTIYHVKDGEFRQYRGSRDGDALMLFLKQKQWQQLEPISAWKKPDTIHMSILSYFFKMSHSLKDFNARLQEEYGLPTWGSYALFAIGTIFVGAALGLLLVCVVDFLYPPKKSQRQSFSEAKEKSLHAGGAGVEDLANDEIEDDDEIPPQLVDIKAKNDDGNANEDEDDDHADDDDDNGSTTSDGEKKSQSENDDENPKRIDGKGDEAPTTTTNKSQAQTNSTTTRESPSDVRKRKPRKAD